MGTNCNRCQLPSTRCHTELRQVRVMSYSRPARCPASVKRSSMALHAVLPAPRLGLTPSSMGHHRQRFSGSVEAPFLLRKSKPVMRGSAGTTTGAGSPSIDSAVPRPRRYMGISCLSAHLRLLEAGLLDRVHDQPPRGDL